jgi:DNA-directed RNA polymerase specialized sigma24 family protein
LDSLEAPAQIEHWVARVAAHTVYKELRRRRRRLRLLPANVAESALACSGYQTDLDGRELLQRAGRALDQLSAEHGGLLWQRLFEHNTLEEMAARLQRARVRFERLAASDGLLKERLAQ